MARAFVYFAVPAWVQAFSMTQRDAASLTRGPRPPVAAYRNRRWRPGAP